VQTSMQSMFVKVKTMRVSDVAMIDPNIVCSRMFLADILPWRPISL